MHEFPLVLKGNGSGFFLAGLLLVAPETQALGMLYESVFLTGQKTLEATGQKTLGLRPAGEPISQLQK